MRAARRQQLTNALRIASPDTCIVCAMLEDVESGEVSTARAIATAYVLGQHRAGLEVCNGHFDTTLQAAEAVDKHSQKKGGAS